MIIIVGCGGGGASGDDMCGGDAVGTWTITSSNLTVDVPKFDLACPTAAGTSSNIAASGTLTYNADLSYSDDVTITGNVTLDLPASCVSSGLSCADLGSHLVTAGVFEAATCAVAGTGCTCTAVLPGQPSTDVGTFTTAAGVLTETSTGSATGEGLAYCVKGMTLTESSGTAARNGFVGSITLTKQ
jgi:hypothetical protein